MAKVPFWIKWLARLAGNKTNPVLPESPEPGTWYRVPMPELMASDGSAYGFDVRFGTENKTILFFHGGGMSWDEHMAAHPTTLGGELDNMYYTPTAGCYSGNLGLFSRKESNPFRNWNVISLPYCTGDFHCGTADFPYEDENGAQQILRHHGYTNTMAALGKAITLLPQPKKLLICGNSAGAFAAAFLTQSILPLFPACKDVTVYCDSAMCIQDDWARILRDVWKSPEAVWSVVHTENAVLDGLLALKETYKDVKILFSCSVRDYNLSMIEGYRETGRMTAKKEYGEHFQKYLSQMCQSLTGCGLFLFDTPVPGAPGKMGFTKHCIIIDLAANRIRSDGSTVIAWLHNGVNGDLQQLGTKLL